MPRFSLDGARLAYPSNRPVVVDGTPGERYDEIAPDSLAWSADGRRLAFAAKRDHSVTHDAATRSCPTEEEYEMRSFVALALALSLVDPLALCAQKPKEQKGKSQDSRRTVVFSDGQREAARLYFVEAHGRGNCPPGLAKKQNGCLPPGQAKKRYVVGHSLPQGIVVEMLPVELSVRIGPVPPGYRYGILDGDLVKLAVGTMLVVDAIEGLVR